MAEKYSVLTEKSLTWRLDDFYPYKELTIDIADLKKDSEYFTAEQKQKDALGQIKDEVNKKISSIKLKMFEIGCLLHVAKKVLDHGKFKNWIEDNFDFSYQTANNFMNVYTYCLGFEDLVEKMKPSVLYQIASPNFPEDLREHIFENWDYQTEIKNKEIKKICTRFKKGKIGVNSPEIKRFGQFKRESDGGELHELQINRCLKSLERFKTDLVKICHKVQKWPDPRSEKKTIALKKSQAGTLEDRLEEILYAVNTIFPKSYTIMRNFMPKYDSKRKDVANLKKEDCDEVREIWKEKPFRWQIEYEKKQKAKKKAEEDAKKDKESKSKK
ncbi:DUF3102 domain-containing protein [Thermodesulfobacteriota bacterium]